jgi:hypothetical protein
MMVKVGHSGVQTQELLSASPSLEEELFALAVAYNPVRLEMAQGADQLKVSPLRIFNRASLLLIRTLWLSAWRGLWPLVAYRSIWHNLYRFRLIFALRPTPHDGIGALTIRPPEIPGTVLEHDLNALKERTK